MQPILTLIFGATMNIMLEFKTLFAKQTKKYFQQISREKMAIN